MEIKNSKIVNLILSGGSGTRLWPLSRKSNPKQFLKIFDNQSLFQHTLLRNSKIIDDFLLVTNISQFNDAQKQASELNFEKLKTIIEPIGRNTAPAIALAAMTLGTEDVMIVTPSDHMITDDEHYHKSMSRAIELAKNNYLVTFGIKPTSPNTGFGYIESDGENVISFREKPDYKTAKNFLEKGNFSWNSGMFCFKAGVFLKELKEHHPTMFSAVTEAFDTLHDNTVDLEAMQNIPSDSIDYAIMEKSSRIKTISSEFYWTDLGTFDSIINYFEEQKGNVNNIEKTRHNCYAFSKKKVYSNIENLVIVDTEDALVILEKGKTNDIKQIFEQVKAETPDLTE